MNRIARSAARVIVAERWTLAVFLAALAVRVHWNLVVHPPEDYVYSDMNGYVSRADALFRETWTPREYSGFYPWGTHVLIYALKLTFGRDNASALGAAFATMGAFVAMFGYLVARRVASHRWVAPAVGLALVVDYPLISLGGYFLSETPFAVGLMAATWLLLRVVDHGRARDAWLAGVAVAFATVMRPQMLMSVALFAVIWLIWRRHYPKLGPWMILRAAIPLVLVLGFSAVRLHHHTGRWGLIAENGTFNQVFGRCHNWKIVAHAKTWTGSKTVFGPPPLLQLSKRKIREPGAWPQLDPVLEERLAYVGYIGDAEKLREYMRECVEKSGWLKQAEYALVHVLMLWRYNVLWPDSGKADLSARAGSWGEFHAIAVALPAMLGLALAWPRRHPKLALVALHVWALFGVAALHFGDVRLRTPYDPVLLLLAFEGATIVATRLWRVGARRSRTVA